MLLIGDSISIAYTPYVRERLTGHANVHRIPANGAATTLGLVQIDHWLGIGRWDVIHFNWGLHDLILVSTGSHAVPLEPYARNLRLLVQRMQRTGAALIWASTTPVPKGRLVPRRNQGDEVLYNAAALRVMLVHGVAVNNLHAFARPRLKKIQNSSNVHFTAEGSAALADEVAQAVLRALESRAQKKRLKTHVDGESSHRPSRAD